AFSPDGRTLAAGDGKTGEILLWDLGGDQPKDRGVLGRGGLCGFSPDGRTLLAVQLSSASSPRFSHKGADPVTVQVWDVERKRLQAQFELEGKVRGWWSCSKGGLAPDGGRLVNLPEESLHGPLVVWSAATGKRLREYRLPGTCSSKSTGTPFAFAPDGRHLAVNND